MLDYYGGNHGCLPAHHCQLPAHPCQVTLPLQPARLRSYNSGPTLHIFYYERKVCLLRYEYNKNLIAMVIGVSARVLEYNIITALHRL